MNHTELGASKADRWINCPGSIQLSRGVATSQSDHALEGQAAHEVAERTWKGEIIAAGDIVKTVAVTEEMLEAVAVYHAEIKRHTAEYRETPQIWVERQFNLAKLNPPAEMFGTSDFVEFFQRKRHLVVTDFKYGQGVIVEVERNAQLLMYALGAVLSIEEQIDFGYGRIDTVEIVIVQPRAFHKDGPVRSWTTTYEEIIAFAVELLAAARRTQEPDAPLNPGDHCRWCPAKAMCPARTALVSQTVELDFKDPVVVTDPRLLPLGDVLRVLALAPIIEDWFKSARDMIEGKLNRGEDVPGWKVVPKRANRKWIDDEVVRSRLRDKGLSDEVICEEPALRTPAQLEARLRKVKSQPAREALVLLPELWEKKSSGNTLVRDTDPRPSVLIGPGSDFAEPA